MKKFILLFSLLTTIASGLRCQKDLTIAEVFDFDVGDQFHIRFSMDYYLWSYRIDRYSIIDKWYSLNFDTVYYSRNIDGYEQYWGPPPTWRFYKGIDTVSYTHLDSSIYIYEELMCSRCSYDSLISNYDSLKVDTIMKQDPHWCNTFINGAQYYSNPEELAATYTYGKGIGLAFSSFFEGLQSAPIVNNLLYYKKDTTTCGTPDWFNSVIEFENSLNLKISPNPNKGEFTIELQEYAKGQIQIYNSMGGIVHSELIQEKANILINLPSSLKDGIYIVKLIGEDSIAAQKLILQRE